MRYFLLFATFILLATSCYQIFGSGNIITQKRNTATFTGVSVGSAFEVEIKKGTSNEVIVESDDNLLEYIETNVDDGVLEIRHQRNRNFSNGHYKVFLTMPEIDFVKASGAASIKILDPLGSKTNINLEASGAATIDAKLDAPNIDVKSSGASTMNLSGTTQNFTVKASGSSEIKSALLSSENTKVTSSGASSINAFASVSLQAKASGASNINYQGTKNVTLKSSGASTIKRID